VVGGEHEDLRARHFWSGAAEAAGEPAGKIFEPPQRAGGFRELLLPLAGSRFGTGIR
jgi:hypothetical protein